MGLRHGGSTESGDAELTDAQIRALSGHTTAAMTTLYTKATMRQRRAGARKRLEERERKGGICRNEPLTWRRSELCWNLIWRGLQDMRLSC